MRCLENDEMGYEEGIDGGSENEGGEWFVRFWYANFLNPWSLFSFSFSFSYMRLFFGYEVKN